MACLCRLAYIAADRDISTARQIITSAIFNRDYDLRECLRAEGIPILNGQSACYGILLSAPEHAIVAIRGTYNIKDWLFNFLANANSNDIHAGVWHLTNGLWQQISSFLASKENQGKSVLLAGHSLGGAVVTLATYRLLREFPHLTIEAAYSFGALPVSSNKLDLGPNFFRMRTSKDFVPHILQLLSSLEGLVPVAASRPKYQHSGVELLIDDNYEILMEGNWNEIRQLAIAVRAMVSRRGLSNATEVVAEEIARGHHLVRYIQLLNYGIVPTELSI